MTRHLCDVKGFRGALDDASKIGLPQFLEFYKTNQRFSKGEAIFNSQFLPFIDRYVDNPGVSLEIGYGPGRQLFQAAKHFDVAIGIDVHGKNGLILSDLFKNDCTNIQLLTTDGYSIPVEDGTVDFIHSWTVFMHFGKVDVVENYLKESFRVLRKEGVAVIYFAELKRESPVGAYFEEIPNRAVNRINLLISIDWMIYQSEKVGFKVLEWRASDHAIHGIKEFHGQTALVLGK